MENYLRSSTLVSTQIFPSHTKDNMKVLWENPCTFCRL